MNYRPQVAYGDESDEMGGAAFERSCPACGRLVRADKSIVFDGRGQPKEPNATCKRCGRVAMPFLGYVP